MQSLPASDPMLTEKSTRYVAFGESSVTRRRTNMNRSSLWLLPEMNSPLRLGLKIGQQRPQIEAQLEEAVLPLRKVGEPAAPAPRALREIEAEGLLVVVVADAQTATAGTAEHALFGIHDARGGE